MARGPELVVDIANKMVKNQTEQFQAIAELGKTQRENLLAEFDVPTRLAEQERARIDAEIELIKAPYDVAAAPMQGRRTLLEAERDLIMAEYGLQAAPDRGRASVLEAENSRLEAERLRYEKRRDLDNEIRTDVVKRELDAFLIEKGYAIDGYDGLDDLDVTLDYYYDLVQNAKNSDMSSAAFNHLNRDLKIAYRTLLDRGFADVNEVLEIENMSPENRRAVLAERSISGRQFELMLELGRADGKIPERDITTSPDAVPSDDTPTTETPAPATTVDPATTIAPAAPAATAPTEESATAEESTTRDTRVLTPATMSIVSAGKLQITPSSDPNTPYNWGTSKPSPGGIYMSNAEAKFITGTVQGYSAGANPADNFTNAPSLMQGAVEFGPEAVSLKEQLGGYAELEAAFNDPAVGSAMVALAKAHEFVKEQFDLKPDVIFDANEFRERARSVKADMPFFRSILVHARANYYVADPNIRETLVAMGVKRSVIEQIYNAPDTANMLDKNEVTVLVENASRGTSSRAVAAQNRYFYSLIAGGLAGD